MSDIWVLILILVGVVLLMGYAYFSSEVQTLRNKLAAASTNEEREKIKKALVPAKFLRGFFGFPILVAVFLGVLFLISLFWDKGVW